MSQDGYELRANRDYESGEEILATYGAHSNDKLLVHCKENLYSTHARI